MRKTYTIFKNNKAGNSLTIDNITRTQIVTEGTIESIALGPIVGFATKSLTAGVFAGVGGPTVVALLGLVDIKFNKGRVTDGFVNFMRSFYKVLCCSCSQLAENTSCQEPEATPLIP